MIALLATLAAASDLELGGDVAANLHLGLVDCPNPADCRLLDFQDLVIVGGHVAGNPTDGVAFEVRGRLRLHPGLDARELADTERGQQIQPLTLDVPEAWIELRELFVPALDVRLGQQRFAWGAADGWNPVDIVNPVDLADPTRFDRRLGVPALSGRLHHQQTALQVAWVPLFRPARLPAGLDILEDADDLFDFSDVGGGDLELGELETRTTFPDNRVGFASVAARGTVATSFADLGVTGYLGRDSLPQVGGEAILVGIATADGRVDVGVPVIYPKMALVGVDARGELPLDLAGWFEVALVDPERTVVTASRGQLQGLLDLELIEEIPDPLPETVIQDGKPYARAVVGLERFFGPLQLNLQWMHGLPTERRADEVRDYAALAAIVTIADPVQLQLRGISDGSGWLASARLDLLHRDAATVNLGVTWIDGPDGSALGQLSKQSNASLGVSTAF